MRHFSFFLPLSFFFLSLAFPFFSLAHESSVHDKELEAVMEELGDTFKATRRVQNKEELQTLVEQMLELQNQAASIGIEPTSDLPVFKQGMEELNQVLTKALEVINSGNQSDIRQALKEANDVRKKYHQKLDVRNR